jgi:uncharacterized Zn-binding protein involved in type VI secretion
MPQHLQNTMGLHRPISREVLPDMLSAARLSDMHICSMITPGVPPNSHVGGPILPPCEITVLTGGLPQARATDMTVCVGPPDMIVMGSMTVLPHHGPRDARRNDHAGRVYGPDRRLGA